MGPSDGDNRVNGYKRYGLRAVLAAELSPSIDATLILDWRKSDDDCCTEIAATTPTNANALLALSGVQFLGDKTRTIKTNLAARSEQESYGASLQLDAEVGSNTLTSITAYRRFDENEIREGDLLDRAYVGLPQTHDVGPPTGKTCSMSFGRSAWPWWRCPRAWKTQRSFCDIRRLDRVFERSPNVQQGDKSGRTV